MAHMGTLLKLNFTRIKVDTSAPNVYYTNSLHEVIKGRKIMKMFEHNGIEVYALEYAMDFLLIQEHHQPLFQHDLNQVETQKGLHKIGIATSMFERATRQQLSPGCYIPGSVILWSPDESLSPMQRFEVAVDAEPNNKGGKSYSSIPLDELSGENASESIRLMLVKSLLGSILEQSDESSNCGSDCPSCEKESECKPVKTPTGSASEKIQ